MFLSFFISMCHIAIAFLFYVMYAVARAARQTSDGSTLE